MRTLPVLHFGWDDDDQGYGGLVNLLTREEEEHIINSKGRCGPGEPLGKRACLP